MKKRIEKTLGSFILVFLLLALVSGILYMAFNIDLISTASRIVIITIMFGIPAIVYFKSKDDSVN